MAVSRSTRARPASAPAHAGRGFARRLDAWRSLAGHLVLLGVLLAQVGCGGSWDGGELYVRRPKFAQGPGRETSFRVGLPGAGWHPLHERGTQVAWQRDDPPGAIQVRSQCEEHGDSDLQDFTDHLRIDFGAWEILEQEPIRLIGREALRSRVSAALDGVPVMLEIYVVKKDGCLFDLTYTALPYAFERGLQAFQQVVEGFAFPVGRGDTDARRAQGSLGAAGSSHASVGTGGSSGSRAPTVAGGGERRG